MGKSPMFLILPLASAVQLAFILPVANPSMAITYAYGRFTMPEWVSSMEIGDCSNKMIY